MKSSDTNIYPLEKQMPILIGSGELAIGMVTLSDSGTLAIEGNATRITRLLASIRRLPHYRKLTNEEFFACIPEALGVGPIWATPLESVPRTGEEQMNHSLPALGTRYT